MAEMYYIKGDCGNNLKFVDELLENMVKVMIQHGSDDFWKLLKYPSKTAWSQPNVSLPDRAKLVKDGLIKRVAYNNDISTEAHNELRIFPHRWDGNGVDGYELRIGFDVICHNNIIELTNGKTAGMIMVHEMLELFNGSQISKNLGAFTIEGMNGGIMYYNSEYQGYRFYIRGNS